MNSATSWREDYQVMLEEIQASLENESTRDKIAGKLLLLRIIGDLKPIFKKCQQETTLETGQMAADYVKKLLDEERGKMESAGFC